MNNYYIVILTFLQPVGFPRRRQKMMMMIGRRMERMGGALTPNNIIIL